MRRPPISAGLVCQKLNFDQPHLMVEEAERYISVFGEYLISAPESCSWSGAIDRFNIRVRIPKSFPYVEPVVFEVGGRIPRTSGRHCNPDGSCCIGVWEEWIAQNLDRTIEEFFEGPLRNFFLSQVYFEKNGMWPFGERSHGNAGVIEACADLMKVDKNEKLIKRYLTILCGKWPKGHWICPCGSGEKIRKCHRSELMSMHRRISPYIAKSLLKRLMPPKSEHMPRRSHH